MRQRHINELSAALDGASAVTGLLPVLNVVVAEYGVRNRKPTSVRGLRSALINCAPLLCFDAVPCAAFHESSLLTCIRALSCPLSVAPSSLNAHRDGERTRIETER